MSAIFPEYRVDHLVLLIGSNPLPNLVAVQLQADQNTRIILVHSHESVAIQQRLYQKLKEKNYSLLSVEVDESDSSDIRAKLGSVLQKCQGRVGIHYTGGTKAMSVHACLIAKEKLESQRLFLSYLDARGLKLWVEGPGITGVIPRNIGLNVRVELQDLLDLHEMGNLKKQPRTQSIWPTVTQDLATIHSDTDQAKQWREWCNRELRRTNKPADFKSKTDLKAISMESMPFESVGQALLQDIPSLSNPTRFEFIKPALLSDLEDLAKWFDGEWLENYVFDQVQKLVQSHQLHDLKMSINPERNGVDFEFDVVFVRGYRLFAVSCSTVQKDSECKSKLLEAFIRARQLGGDEARVALVCCSPRPRKIQAEVIDLLGQGLIRVFGANDLLTLSIGLQGWIELEDVRRG